MSDDAETRTALLQKIEALVDSPEGYTALTDALIAQTGADIEALGAFEATASGDLARLLDQTTLLQQREGLERGDVDSLRLSTSPAFLIRADGAVIGRNDAALDRTSGEAVERVDALGFAPDDAASLGDLIAGVARSKGAETGVALHPARDALGRRVTLATAPRLIDPDGAPGALLFVVDPVMRPEAVSLMGRTYGLTGAETEILTAFCDGASLRQIAEDRGRSHATIRTQFQSITEKTGVGGQAELMRSSQAMSRFADEMGGIADMTVRSTRKRFDVMRPGGRSVDVLRCGDPAGAPAVFMHGAFAHSFTPAAEQVLHDAGLALYVIGRPGLGATDPPARGADRDQVVAEDIQGVLAQIGVEHAPFLAHSGGVPEVFRAAAAGLAPHIERLVMVGPLPPPRYVVRHAKASATMTAALMFAARSNRPLLRLLLSGRHRMYLRMGTARFLAKKFAASPADLAMVRRPDVAAEFDSAAEFTTAQGYAAGAAELVAAMANWEGDVASFPAPVLALQGREDPIAPLAAVEDFASAHAGITLEVVEDAGHTLLSARPDLVADRLLKGWG